MNMTDEDVPERYIWALTFVLSVLAVMAFALAKWLGL